MHRDIKAANILLGHDGEVTLCDYGVASMVNQRGVQTDNCETFVGTPCWMAPELMQQNIPYGHKADMWSIGITALELAKGEAPYEQERPMKIILMTLSQDAPTLETYTKCVCVLCVFALSARASLSSHLYSRRLRLCPSPSHVPFALVLHHNFVSVLRYTRKGPAGTPEPKKARDFGRDFKSLLANLVMTDPAKRYSAHDALNHKFMKQFFNREVKCIKAERGAAAWDRLGQGRIAKRAERMKVCVSSCDLLVSLLRVSSALLQHSIPCTHARALSLCRLVHLFPHSHTRLPSTPSTPPARRYNDLNGFFTGTELKSPLNKVLTDELIANPESVTSGVGTPLMTCEQRRAVAVTTEDDFEAGFAADKEEALKEAFSPTAASGGGAFAAK